MTDIEHSQSDELKKFAVLTAGTLLQAFVAFILAAIFGVSLWSMVVGDGADVAVGFVATAPLVAALYWFMKVDRGAIAEFRQSQIEFFAETGIRFSWLQITILAAAAGVCEELLFRGALQSVLGKYMPLIFAIFLANLVFGLLHWRTALYAAIAFALGLYMSALLFWTGNLTAPIVTHALYDFVAFYFTRRELAALRRAA